MKLIFKGVVQGVGFRPTIYRIAKKLELKGYVLNKGSEVEVVIDNKKDEFIKQVKDNLPSIAKITDIIEKKDDRKFSDFKILHSKKGERQSLIPIDIGICDDCLKELFDNSDKRYLFPFTNCTVCGARYSLARDVPYDRERTSMDTFKLCKSCQQEYVNPLDRRYHAQTISCSACGPVYRLYNKKKEDLGKKDSIKKFSDEIDLGKIGIIKSWGGMHICCRLDEIKRFRKWYHRPQKAFAVMVKDIKTAEKYAEITNEEQKLLLSKSKPIVLVKKIGNKEISPGLNTIGLFLPYTGLHYLLFSFMNSDALIMTSANIPGEPMLTTNEEAFSLDADAYLLHNRDIPNRIDDTVVRLWKDNTFFIRKSRGFVPEPIPVSYNKKILSVGADENITGAISHDNFIFATQYIGNSKYYASLEFLEESIRHLLKLTMKKPEIDAVVQDLHPGYDTRNVAEKFSKELSAPIYEVQHDWAHAASLLVDNNLDRSVVISIEGLGYGPDKTFWGGEVLLSDFDNYERVGHLEYIPLLGGDMATINPQRLVYAIFKKYGKEKIFKGSEALILTKLIDKAPQSCSLGRYLDAISSYLGICTKMTYSGEPAMKLEKYLAAGKDKYKLKAEIKDNVVNVTDLFNQIDEIVSPPFNEKQKADISYSIVNAIVRSLCDIAIKNAFDNNIKTIGLTGGVSYNVPITEIVDRLVKKEGLKLIVHKNIPNGDGGISIGQNAIVGHKLSS
jgi:hydrogenase maturation protein HypF